MPTRHSWMLAALWAITIFALSSIPGRSFPAMQIFNYDKVIHAGVYAVLGGLCLLALRRTWSPGVGRLIATATLLALVYGATDELHQLFVPGRSADLYDALADGIGGFVGASLAALVPLARSGRATPRDA